MLYGLSFLPDCTGNSKSAQMYFSDVIQLSVTADEAGLDYVKMTEHYLDAYGGYCPSPLNFLSAVASRTKKIRLMTGCILPAFHHPIQIAAETAMTDAISGGRLDVGFARAYLPYEFEALGINIDQSRQRYISTILSVVDLWTGKNVSAKTPFFEYENVNSLPSCTQKPHPPVWGAAVNSRQSFAWIGENLFNLLVTPPLGDSNKLIESINLYRETFCQTALEKKIKREPKVLMSIPLIIAPNMSEAVTLGEKFLKHYVDIWSSATLSLTKTSSLDYPHYDKVHQTLKNLTPHNMMKNLHSFVGTADSVLSSIFEVKEKFAIDGIIWQIDFGEQPLEISMRSLKYFVDQVLPHCKAEFV